MTDDNGLYYMRARFYSQEIRRFVNQDVLLGNVDEGQTLNRYAYVTGQPVSFIDPFGLKRCGPGYKAIPDPKQPHVSLCQPDGSDPYENICVTAECGMHGVAATQTAVGLFNVHLCFGKIRDYHHAYICVNRKCAGLMPVNKNFSPSSTYCSGAVTEEDFNEQHCSVATLPKNCNRDVYGSCIKNYVDSKGTCGYYNLFLHDCIHEVLEVDASCISKSCPN